MSPDLHRDSYKSNNNPNIWLGPELNDNVENGIKNFSIDKSY